MSNFTSHYKKFAADPGKKITEIQVKLVCKAQAGTINVTDVMLQRGRVSTEWAAHPSEIKWTLND